MATLAGQTIASTYISLLKTSNNSPNLASGATTERIVLGLDADATDNLGANRSDSIEIAAGESLALKLNCPVADLHAEAGNAAYGADSSPTVTQCIVAAIINDAS